MANLKTCKGCGSEKPLTDFYTVRARGKERPNSHCKPCVAIKDARPRNRFSRSKITATKYGIPWTLTVEQFEALATEPCHYCKRFFENKGKGLDRRDPNKGYTPDNVLPCCWLCNYSKSRLYTVEEQEQVSALYDKFDARRKELGLPPLQPPIRGGSGGKHTHGWRDGGAWK